MDANVSDTADNVAADGHSADTIAERIQESCGELAIGDFAAAEQFVRNWGGRVLYNHSTADWYIWDGRRWTEDTQGETRELGKVTLQAIEQAIRATSTDKAEIRRAREANGTRGLRNMLWAAETIPAVSASLDEFDANPLLFNAANGVLDLQSWERGRFTLRPHDPKYRITKLSPCVYDPTATAPLWDQYITRFCNRDFDLLMYIQTGLGYSMTGLRQEKCFFLLQGPTGTGKSVLTNTALHLLGDYGCDAPWETFLAQAHTNERPRPDLVRLRGTRMVVAQEGEENARLSESIIKKITGRDAITARDLNKSHISFPPTFKIWLGTNHLPQIRNPDDSIWLRVHRIPCTAAIPEAQQDRQLEEKLRDESSGILNWFLLGFASYLDDGLVRPQVVVDATQEYRAKSDVLNEFLEDHCERADGLMVQKGTLYTTYVQWAKDRNLRVWDARRFSQALVDRGFIEHRTKSTRYWLGWALRGESTPTTLGF